MSNDNFLHNHPIKEAQLRLDNNHVIVDKKDWEIARTSLHHVIDKTKSLLPTRTNHISNISDRIQYKDLIRTKLEKAEKIICSAIWVIDKDKEEKNIDNISIGIVVTGLRHHNCIRTLNSIYTKEQYAVLSKVQGFLSSHNRFLSRDEALDIAMKVGQVITPIMPGQLDSSDLY